MAKALDGGTARVTHACCRGGSRMPTQKGCGLGEFTPSMSASSPICHGAGSIPISRLVGNNPPRTSHLTRTGLSANRGFRRTDNRTGHCRVFCVGKFLQSTFWTARVLMVSFCTDDLAWPSIASLGCVAGTMRPAFAIRSPALWFVDASYQDVNRLLTPHARAILPLFFRGSAPTRAYGSTMLAREVDIDENTR